MRRSVSIPCVVIGALIAAVGCSSPQNGTPTPTDATGSTGSGDPSPTNLNGAPHIADPLNAAKFLRNPCASITPSQLAALHIGPTTSPSNAGGPTCDWGSDVDYTFSHASVGYLTDGGGLATVYGQKSIYAVFTVLPSIDGYPAVYALTVDQRSSGNCDITIGASDSLDFDVQINVNSGPEQTDPCTPDRQLAVDVISNIKNGGS